MSNLKVKIGAGAAAIAAAVVLHFEGTVYKTYRDPINVLTSCTGHTGPELKMGQTFTPEQCAQQLDEDLSTHADALECIDVPLTTGQKAAFVSFAFNIGEKKFCQSTLVKKANRGDMVGACAELSRWTQAGGRELPGLVARRAVERGLCEGKTVWLGKTRLDPNQTGESK